MQKKKSLCVEFCRSRAAEESSGISWILIEFTNSTVNFLIHVVTSQLQETAAVSTTCNSRNWLNLSSCCSRSRLAMKRNGPGPGTLLVDVCSTAYIRWSCGSLS